MDYDLDELEAIMDEGQAEAECPACGETATVEPDGDYPCECGEGRLTSPLVLAGLI